MDSEVKSEYLEAQRMAIKALEQQPKTEYMTIVNKNRMTIEEAIKILKFEAGYFCDFKGCQEQQAFAMAIKALESQKWIPCSERLPERGVWVLTHCKTKDGHEYQTVLLLGKYNGEWTDCDDFCDEVISWMPLPEAYKEGDKNAKIN